jgi:hypothetical protein
MGISAGKAVKGAVRALVKHAFHTEPLREGMTRSYSHASHVIIDCGMDLRRKPPSVRTGAGLVRWYYTTRLKTMVETGRTVVLVFDSTRGTPLNKSACHNKFRPVARPADGCPLYTDKGPLPDAWHTVMASGYRRLALFEYLLMGLRARLTKGPDARKEQAAGAGAVFAHTPYSPVTHYGSDLLGGGVVELTQTGAPGLCPGPHGEGDMRCPAWSEFFASQPGAGIIIVRAFDLDLMAIYAARPPPPTPVLVHIANPTPASAEFISVPRLHAGLAGLGVSPDKFVTALILCGTDFFEGVKGVGGDKIVRAALHHPHAAVDAPEDLLRAASPRYKGPLTPGARARVAWNLAYWQSVGAWPAPGRSGGWHEQGGRMYPAS